jgi:hypothetical protein
MLAAFGGTCYNCQEKGHRANQCLKKTGPNNRNRSEGGNTRGKFSGICNHCGKIGHKKSNFWQLDENKNRHLKNFRGGNAEHANDAISAEGGEDGNGPEFLMCALCYDEEQGSTATDYAVRVFDDIEEGKIEFVNENDAETFDFMSGYEEEESEGSVDMIKDFDYPIADEPVMETDLCAMTFLNSMKLLLDPDVWIADTGATVHATPNPSAMVKESEKKCSDTITMGNGESEATEWYGCLPVNVCDMEGNVKGDSKMTHVAYVPN